MRMQVGENRTLPTTSARCLIASTITCWAIQRWLCQWRSLLKGCRLGFRSSAGPIGKTRSWRSRRSCSRRVSGRRSLVSDRAWTIAWSLRQLGLRTEQEQNERSISYGGLVAGSADHPDDGGDLLLVHHATDDQVENCREIGRAHV